MMIPEPDTRTGVVAYLGDYPITEESKCTEALVGASFCQSATLDYKGKKVLMFVFSVRHILLPRYSFSFRVYLPSHYGWRKRDTSPVIDIAVGVVSHFRHVSSMLLLSVFANSRRKY